MEQYYCQTCGRTMAANQFYLSTRLDKYPPDGHMRECKKCLTRHVNNNDPQTFLWILQELDLPYIKGEWDTLLERYGKGPKVTGTTILGRYISKMKLNQYREYKWADTERLKAQMEGNARKTLAAQGYEQEEINNIVEHSFSSAMSLPKRDELAQDIVTPDAPPPPPPPPAPPPPPQLEIPSDHLASEPIDLTTPDDFDDDLTDEDRKYLSLKWGRSYKPYEWIQLEQYYNDMCQSFDIQTPSHVDYLKLICKTSLKCHQLLNINDIEGFQKMSRTYDMLMKSAKFTPAQNKQENGEFVDSLSELVRIAEQEGFIPRYYTDKPEDKVDATLRDMRNYTDTLVRDELNLGNLIENAIRTMSSQDSKEDDEEVDDEDLFAETVPMELDDEDFIKHYDNLEQQREEDDENGVS